MKVDIFINETAVPELSTIAHISRAREHGKRLVERLEENIPRQHLCHRFLPHKKDEQKLGDQLHVA